METIEGTIVNTVNTGLTMLDHALAYAERGWFVIPLFTPDPNSKTGCDCKERVCDAVGKHPRLGNGSKGAAIDTPTIRKWWIKSPNANIGVYTGSASNLFVLDIDGGSGSDSLKVLELEIGPLPDTLTASTGNGLHMLFNYPAEGGKNTTGKLGLGLDTRGDGGYFVAPPSLHRSSKQYAWVNALPLADFPEAYLDRLIAKTKGRIDHHAPERNNHRKQSMFKYAASKRGQEAMELPELRTALHEYNAGFDTPKEDYWVETIAESVCKQYEAQHGKRSHGSPVYWWRFNNPDWMVRTAQMTDIQRGWYIQLKTIAHQSRGFLPNNMKELARLAGAKSEKNFANNSYEVLRDFVEVEANGIRRLVHPELAADYAYALDLVNKKKKGPAVREANKAATKAGLPISTGSPVLTELEALFEPKKGEQE